MITIHKSPTADTRTCDFANVSEETLYKSSLEHIAVAEIYGAYVRLMPWNRYVYEGQ